MARRRGSRDRRETPQETWERMRSAGGSDARPPTIAPAPRGEAREHEQPPAPRGEAREHEQPPAPRGEAREHEQPPAPRGEAREYEQPVPERRPERDRPPAPEREPSNGTSSSETDEQPVAELVKQLTDQTKTLVKQEMRLAQVELQEKGKKLGIGAGMFGAGGLVAFFATAVLIAALILGLSTALAPWLAALIVGVVLLAAAGGAALMGKKKVEEATPPAPEHAIGSVKRDVDTVKRRARK